MAKLVKPAGRATSQGKKATAPKKEFKLTRFIQGDGLSAIHECVDSEIGEEPGRIGFTEFARCFDKFEMTTKPLATRTGTTYADSSLSIKKEIYGVSATTPDGEVISWAMMMPAKAEDRSLFPYGHDQGDDGMLELEEETVCARIKEVADNCAYKYIDFGQASKSSAQEYSYSGTWKAVDVKTKSSSKA